MIYRGHVVNRQTGLSHLFLPALSLKIIAGICLGVLYMFFYGYGDTILYFKDAHTLGDLFFESWENYLLFMIDRFQIPLYYTDNPRALFFVKLISPLVIFTYNSYWFTSIYLSLISFYASWNLVLIIRKYFPNFMMGAVIGLLFFPSVVFWSSGVVKESLAFTLIVILIANFIQIYNNEPFSLKKVIINLVLLLLLFQLKYYYLAAFLIAIAPTLILKYISWRTLVKHSVFSWIVLLVLAAAGVSLIHPNLSVHRFIEVIVENNQLYENHFELSKTINYYNLESTFWSLLINTPIALFSILFRPLLFEAGTWLQVALSIENLILFILIIAWIFKRGKIRMTPLLMSCLVYVMVLGVFLAISTPNFGSLSRYRISFLPVLIILISHNSLIFEWLDKMNSKFINRKT